MALVEPMPEHFLPSDVVHLAPGLEDRRLAPPCRDRIAEPRPVGSTARPGLLAHGCSPSIFFM